MHDHFSALLQPLFASFSFYFFFLLYVLIVFTFSLFYFFFIFFLFFYFFFHATHHRNFFNINADKTHLSCINRATPPAGLYSKLYICLFYLYCYNTRLYLLTIHPLLLHENTQHNPPLLILIIMSSRISRSAIRQFSSTALRAFDSETKFTSAKMVSNNASQISASGNNFKTFAEYRLRAIQRGPLTGLKIQPLTTGAAQISSEGITQDFARAARRYDYNDLEN